MTETASRPPWAPDDINAVMKAVGQSREALQWASPFLQANRFLVTAAVTHSGEALQWASEELQKDGELVNLAVRNGLAGARQQAYCLRGEAAPPLLPEAIAHHCRLMMGRLQDQEELHALLRVSIGRGITYIDTLQDAEDRIICHLAVVHSPVGPRFVQEVQQLEGVLREWQQSDETVYTHFKVLQLAAIAGLMMCDADEDQEPYFRYLSDAQRLPLRQKNRVLRARMLLEDEWALEALHRMNAPSKLRDKAAAASLEAQRKWHAAGLVPEVRPMAEDGPVNVEVSGLAGLVCEISATRASTIHEVKCRIREQLHSGDEELRLLFGTVRLVDEDILSDLLLGDFGDNASLKLTLVKQKDHQRQQGGFVRLMYHFPPDENLLEINGGIEIGGRQECRFQKAERLDVGELSRLIVRVCKCVLLHRDPSEAMRSRIRERLHQLYLHLIAPVQDELDRFQCQRILVVTHPTLADVPWWGLQDEDGTHLFEKYIISEIPPSRAFECINKLHYEGLPVERALSPSALLVDVDTQRPEAVPHEDTRKVLDLLRQTGMRVALLQGAEARQQEVVDHLMQNDFLAVLHFCTCNDDPQEDQLFLGDDSYLNTELFDKVNLCGKLVVLPYCESAYIGRCASINGAAHVLCAIGNLADKVCDHLVPAFYENVFCMGLPPDEALCLAMRTVGPVLRNSGEWWEFFNCFSLKLYGVYDPTSKPAYHGAEWMAQIVLR